MEPFLTFVTLYNRGVGRLTHHRQNDVGQALTDIQKSPNPIGHEFVLLLPPLPRPMRGRGQDNNECAEGIISNPSPKPVANTVLAE